MANVFTKKERRPRTTTLSDFGFLNDIEKTGSPRRARVLSPTRRVNPHPTGLVSQKPYNRDHVVRVCYKSAHSWMSMIVYWYQFYNHIWRFECKTYNHHVLSVTFFAIYRVACVQLEHSSLGDLNDIFVTHLLIIIIKSEVSTFHIVMFFRGYVSQVAVPL